MARNNRRLRGGAHMNVYSSQPAMKYSHQPLYMRSMPIRQAASLVERGQARYEYGKGGLEAGPIGIRMLDLVRKTREDATSLTLAVMKSVSGEGLGRIHEIESSRGAQEQALIEKFLVWPLIGDDRAVCVRRRISAEDRRRAEKLLGLKAA